MKDKLTNWLFLTMLVFCIALGYNISYFMFMLREGIGFGFPLGLFGTTIIFEIVALIMITNEHDKRVLENEN